MLYWKCCVEQNLVIEDFFPLVDSMLRVVVTFPEQIFSVVNSVIMRFLIYLMSQSEMQNKLYM